MPTSTAWAGDSNLPSALLEQLRAQMAATSASGSAPNLLDELRSRMADRPSLARQFTASGLQRASDLGGAAGSAFGKGLGLNTAADYITSLLTGEDPEAVRTAREAFTEEEEATVREKLALPQPENKKELAAQIAGSAAPDVALAVASAPIYAAGRAAALGRGVRPLLATLAGETAQSAALAPLEFATRPAGEAVAITAFAPLAGTALSRGAAGLARLLGRGGAEATGQLLPEGARMLPLGEVEALTPNPAPEASRKLVESIRKFGIHDPIEVGVNPETGQRIVFEGKHRLAAARELGLKKVPTREVVIGPGMEGLLRREGEVATKQTFSQEAAGRALARMKESLRTGTPMRTGDLIEMGDDVAEQVAREVRQEALQKSVQAVKAAGAPERELSSFRQQLESSLKEIDPTHNGIIADSIDSLPPAAANRFSRKLAGGALDKSKNLARQIREYRRNSIFSGFGTFDRTAISNLLGLAFKTPKTIGAAVADVPLSLGRKAANILSGHELPAGARQRFFIEIPAEMYGFMKTLPVALKKAGRASRTLRETQVAGVIPGVAGSIIRTPTRGLHFLDELIHGIGYSGEIYRQAARLASQEGSGVFKPQRFARRVGEILADHEKLAAKMDLKRSRAARAQQLLDTAPESMTAKSRGRLRRFIARTNAEWDAMRDQSFIKRASEEADRIVLTNREGSFRATGTTPEGKTIFAASGSRLDQAVDVINYFDEHVPLIGAILPVIRTPANEVREFARSSPAGFLTAPTRAFNMLRHGSTLEAAQGELADKAGQAIMGTLAMYRLLHMVNDGQLRVNPFKEQRRAERVTEESAGIVPDSVLIGNWSIPVSRLGPIGPMILAAARMADIKAGDTPPANTVAELEEYTKQLALQGANEAFFDPLAEFFEAMSSDDRSAGRWLQGVGATFVPRVVSQFNMVTKEPVKPEEVSATGLPSTLANLVAGVRRQIPGFGAADLGLFGKEREVQSPVMSVLLGKTGRLGDNPIAQEMVRVQAYHLPPNGLSKPFQADLSRRGIAYSDAEDRIMRQVKGRMQEQMVQRVVGSPRYQGLPITPAGDALRKQLIDQAFEAASKAVDGRVKALKLAKVPLTERGILGR